jgi:hypothetical protein
MILVSFSRFDRTRGAKDQKFRTYNFCHTAVVACAEVHFECT